MWFLNPGRDALYAILNRILTPYVSNLDLTKFEAGLWAGHFSVNNLRLKKEALDKFRLPIDVIEGTARLDSFSCRHSLTSRAHRSSWAFDIEHTMGKSHVQTG